MVSLHPLPADAAALHALHALHALRRGHPLALPCPRELTRSLRAHLPPHPGYAFSWGQLIEWPGELPDPEREDYTGVRWSIIPVSVWQAVLPRLRARGGHLYQLLEHAWLDGPGCVEGPLPDDVYLDAPLRIAVAGFVTLCAADAGRARRWLADSFLVRRPAGGPRLLSGEPAVVDRQQPTAAHGAASARRRPSMIAAIPVPPRFAGQPLVPCPVPQTLASLLAAQGIGAGQRVFKVFTDEGPVRVGLAQEFQGALGYAFDWGWVLPVLPHWYAADIQPRGVAWRIVPLALWCELAARGRLLEPVPAVLHYAAPRCLDFVAHCVQVPVTEISRALPHDALTLFPDPEDRKGELVGWLEREFLPRELPRALRLLRALALKRAHEIARAADR